MKKLVSVLLALMLLLTMMSFASADSVGDIIAQAQTMTNEELYKKAIEDDETKIIVRDENRTVYANSSFSLHNFQNMVGELEIKGLRKIVKNALNSETEPEEIFQDNRT